MYDSDIGSPLGELLSVQNQQVLNKWEGKVTKLFEHCYMTNTVLVV